MAVLPHVKFVSKCIDEKQWGKKSKYNDIIHNNNDKEIKQKKIF